MRKFISIMFMLLLFAFVYAAQASAELTAVANHDHISIDFFYHGSTVSVKGISDPGTDLIIKIAAPDGHQALRKKGKVAGLLWMNVGKIDFENIPSLYLLTSTKTPEDILGRDALDKNVIGYLALENHSELSPVKDKAEKDEWFNEFIKYKEHSNLYTMSTGKVTYSTEGGKQKYATVFDWPYQAGPGDYIVSVYEVKDGKIIEKAECNVNVAQVGVVKGLAGMAKNNAAVYGIISILAALGAGFGVGLIFRKGGGAH